MDRDPYAAPDSGPLPEGNAESTPEFTPLLVRAMLATIGGLMVGGLLLVAGLGAWSVLGPVHGPPADDPYVFAFLAVLIGGLPLLVIGAPGYALLVRWGKANAFSAAALGAAPGLVLLALGVGIGLVFMAFGVVVALAAHTLFRWGMRSARSST